MGHQFRAICSQCGYNFSVSEGGGFFFHCLHCIKCGKKKAIGFEDLGDIHLRYIKGLSGPYCIPSQNSDKKIQETFAGEPLSEEDYNTLVEVFAGKCRFGGTYSFSGKPRCPKCRSPDYTEDKYGMADYYD